VTPHPAHSPSQLPESASEAPPSAAPVPEAPPLALAGLAALDADAAPRGRGLEASRASMVMAMQRRAGNQAVQRYVQAARPLLQRDATVDAAPPTAAPPLPRPAPAREALRTRPRT
jgi:hypothetical protein